MNDYEIFREALRDALNHLHDPEYHVPPVVTEVVAGQPGETASSVQYAIIQAVNQMAPPPNTPDSASLVRRHRLLVSRFIEGQTQASTAEQLCTTVRNIRREQHVAIHILARSLWERNTLRVPEISMASKGTDMQTEQPASTLLEWQSQARQELAALQRNSPSTANVRDAIRRAMELEKPLAEELGIGLAEGDLAAGLTAAVHPAALRHILIMAIDELGCRGEPGDIHIDAWEEDGSAVLQLRGGKCDESCAGLPPEGSVTGEMLQLLGGTVTTAVADGAVCATIRVPAASEVTVLVIDDNQDFVHFCRRCARGTRFRIVQPTEWTAEAIYRTAPDVILLDIMLPYVDGWDLLATLRRNPAMSKIPVVICSIVREEALASLMGAIEYLPKPIQHQDLITTLERVSAQLSSRTRDASGNSGQQHS